VSTAAGVRFDLVCRGAGLPPPVPEYAFALHRGRKWRFDWAWPAHRLALEVEGGHFGTSAKHRRGVDHVLGDIEKFNVAQLEGWIVLRVIPQQLATAPTCDMVRAALAQRRKD
jgi:hypothetical protein